MDAEEAAAVTLSHENEKEGFCGSNGVGATNQKGKRDNSGPLLNGDGRMVPRH